MCKIHENVPLELISRNQNVPPTSHIGKLSICIYVMYMFIYIYIHNTCKLKKV